MNQIFPILPKYKRMMWAAESSYIATTKTLLEERADVNAKNKDGETAFMVAARKDHTEAVKLLKEAGAKY